MFTGIIEDLGTIKEVIQKGSNRTFWVESPLSMELRVDQSISHNGACLTVEEIRDGAHRVTAIKETLDKTNLGNWEAGSVINLERAMLLNSRLDGHLVQGHVDAVGALIRKSDKKGSWILKFGYPSLYAHLIIEKGSIAVDGISLTAFEVTKESFCAAIIPYTYAHTHLQQMRVGQTVNLEYDLIGKYVQRFHNISFPNGENLKD